jgi:hypothetical protein
LATWLLSILALRDLEEAREQTLLSAELVVLDYVLRIYDASVEKLHVRLQLLLSAAKLHAYERACVQYDALPVTLEAL